MAVRNSLQQWTLGLYRRYAQGISALELVAKPAKSVLYGAVLFQAILLCTACSPDTLVGEPVAVPLQPTQTPVIVEVTRFVPVTATPTPPSESACPDLPLDQIEEIRIGALLPLSNPGAMRHGFSMQAALNIAVDDVNANGGVLGRPVRLLTHDTAGIPSRGAELAERLIVGECVHGLVGLYHDNVARAVSDIAHIYGVPLIIAEASADELTASQFPEVFRIAPTFTQLTEASARWLTSTLGPHQAADTVVVQIVENSAYGQVLTAQNEAAMVAAGLTVKTIMVDLPMRDFSPIIARIVDEEPLPPVIFIYLRNGAGLDVQQQLIEAGIGPDNGTLFVNTETALDATLFWTQVPDGTYTVVRRNGPWPPTVSPVGHSFADQYRRYFDTWPERYAFSAYDAFRLMADAMNRAETLEPATLIEALEQTDVVLASGRYTFPVNRNNRPESDETPDWMWHQWPNVQILFLQYTEPLQASEEMRVIWPSIYATGSGAIRPPDAQSR